MYHTLGMVYSELEKYDLSLEKFETALRLNPSLMETWINIGGVYHKLGRIKEATDSFDRAMAMDPNRFETHFNLANVLQESGEFDQCAGYYETALTLNPLHVKSICNIVQARKYDSVDHPDRVRIAALLDNPDVPAKDDSHLHFAMGKLLNDCGDYDGAFFHYKRGNDLAGARFDRGLHERDILDLTATYDEEYFSRLAGTGVESARPLFIVGMPRSGTTLVEQILTSLPRVDGAGELPDIPWIVRQVPAELGSARDYPECMEDLDKSSAERLAGQYLNRLDLVSTTAERVTDKLPANYLHLGLIAVLFPNATIFHCKRDPIDTCLSCYFQNFSRDLGFSFNLDDLGFYYGLYERLMAHWARVLPLRIHEVVYENLIENPEDVSRGLVRSCGLEWDDGCLAPQKNRRPIKTASSWQVRQPLYKTSIARWKRYEKHLDSLKSSLGLLEEMPV
jgi:tetratricopeptide (TPR) repeat protein